MKFKILIIFLEIILIIIILIVNLLIQCNNFSLFSCHYSRLGHITGVASTIPLAILVGSLIARIIQLTKK